MKKVRRLFVIAIVSLVTLFAMATSASAQEQGGLNKPGFTFSVGSTHVCVGGGDWHFGDRFVAMENLLIKSRTSGDPNSGTNDVPLAVQLTYGVSYDPLVVKPSCNNKGYDFEAAYRFKGRYSLIVRGSKVKATGALQGRIENKEFAITDTAIEVAGLRMFDRSLFPVQDDTEPSGLSVMNYDGEGSLEVGKYGVSLGVDILKKERERARLVLEIGVLALRVETSRSAGFTAHAAVNDPRPEWAKAYDFPWTEELDNNITLKYKGSSGMTLFAPSVGFSGKGKFNRLELGGRGAVFFGLGEATIDASLLDVDSLHLKIAVGDEVLSQTVLLKGDFATSEKRNAFVPGFELEGNASFHVAGPLSIYTRWSMSGLVGVPTGDIWSSPNWEMLGASGFREKKINPMSKRVSIGATMRF